MYLFPRHIAGEENRLPILQTLNGEPLKAHMGLVTISLPPILSR